MVVMQSSPAEAIVRHLLENFNCRILPKSDYDDDDDNFERIHLTANSPWNSMISSLEKEGIPFINAHDGIIEIRTRNSKGQEALVVILTDTTTTLSLQPSTNARKIAVLTSGGDSPGMNAAIRAVVRRAIYAGCECYAVQEGYKGLLEGGRIVRMGWSDVAHILGQGGTIIKSSRCPEFLTRQGRRLAAKNLAEQGIDRLVVIGGDGSLTGSDRLRQEWPELLAEVDEERNSSSLLAAHPRLMIVGLAGSIDNDMAGTEMTIGANSSLHRIIEALDSISSTASSHQRAFVIEVMGRHCGWLALNAALAIGADWLLVPEDPPAEGWESELLETIFRNRRLGRTSSIVIVAEGAVDRQNQPITSEQVRTILQDGGMDARVTTLGHVQRGGGASAYDRYLGTIQGIEAVDVLLPADDETAPSVLVGINENRVTRLDLREAVERTRKVAEAMQACQFGHALHLRNRDFQANYQIWKSIQTSSESLDGGETRRITIGLVNIGAPAGGMNAANRAMVHYCLYKGFRPLGIFGGIQGLVSGDVRPLHWSDTEGWAGTGGSGLGTNRTIPESPECLRAIEKTLTEHSVDGLVMIGGFEAFTAQLVLLDAQKNHPGLCIPTVVLPATISNNVPGTEFSLGCDTALNTIVQACDSLKQSASSSRRRVFVVDVQGGHCGYLATMGGLTSGATRAYLPEEGLRLADLLRDSRHLAERFLEDSKQGRIVLRNEKCSSIYTPDLIARILEEEGGEVYDARWVSLGHLQQGGLPSPLDRIRGTRLAIQCVDFIAAATHEQAVVIGIKGAHVVFTPSRQLRQEGGEEMMRLRRPPNPWWMPLVGTSRMLSKYPPEDGLMMKNKK